MRKFVIFPVVALLLLASCGKKNEALKEGTPAYQLAKAIGEKVPAVSPKTNKVLISTNSFKLTTADVIKVIVESSGRRADQLKSFGADRLKSILNQTAENLAEKRLLLQAAKKAGITVTPADVDSTLDIQYKRAGGKEKFQQFLAQNGVSADYVRKDIQDVLTIQRYLDKKLAKETEVTEADIETAYNEPKTATVRHILLMTQGKSDSAKKAIRKKMEGILARAKKGEDFAKLAKKYSEDPGSKDNGGLYKDFGRGRMVKPFEDAAFNTPVGKISGIIETRYGYHILKVINRKKETKPLSQVHDQLKQQLKQKKQAAAYKALIEKLKKDANFQAFTL